MRPAHWREAPSATRSTLSGRGTSNASLAGCAWGARSGDGKGDAARAARPGTPASSVRRRSHPAIGTSGASQVPASRAAAAAQAAPAPDVGAVDEDGGVSADRDEEEEAANPM